MKKHIEILKNWLKKAENFFNVKYTKIMNHDGRKTNHEMIEYNSAIELQDKINIWNRKLKKMINGKIMPPNVLKKIEALDTEKFN